MDHHLPYWNGLCSSACRELFNPLPCCLSFVPLPFLIKISASTELGNLGFVTWVPHLPGGWHLKIKPLSFISAPASWVLAFVAAGSWTCFRLQFLATPDGDNVDSGKTQRAQAGATPACGRLTPLQRLQEFPSSYWEFFISGILPALPLKH